MFKVTKKVILKDQMHVCLKELLPLLGNVKKKSLGFIKNKSKQQQISKIIYQNKNQTKQNFSLRCTALTTTVFLGIFPEKNPEEHNKALN